MKLQKAITSVIFVVLLSLIGHSQAAQQISTIDFIKINQPYNKEALYFYENNWQVLREQAVKKGYIDSFMLIEVPATSKAAFHLMLMTTYRNKEQFELREKNFSQLMSGSTGPKLLNNVLPEQFRTMMFNKTSSTVVSSER
ncbi:hypothetical protein Q4489_16320 [Thalassotalea sp. 1_MG-2023]|uniref:hypothetical protein n=1 Tax=Thalassotalea sp. 1_MG-2023 TaxID=3062680 RepID=UPI0026E17A3E|nr:hypothetical protein [Thalassotalea sp. 1_MG-2023]MDO6428579.1 hypothetical protein [Thalassotalea sp. 1_MG-2023]